MGLINFIKSLIKKTNNRQVYPEPETLILWEGNKTVKFHWWPMKDQGNYYKCLKNNLYASGGCLDKYDSLFHMKSCEYQKKNYYRHTDSDKPDANWAGFCDSAALLSCTRKYPSHSVKVCYNENSVVFTPEDIEGLMIIVSRNTVSKGLTRFYGERYNYKHLDDINEPYPEDLVNILRDVCSDNIPFAIDICKKDSVWNYAYNSVLVKKVTYYPERFIDKVSKLSKTDNLLYYNFVINSTAYPEKNINIWGWHCEETNKGGWLSDEHPDFVWKKYSLSGPWKGVCDINPDVSVSQVYEIYMASISGIDEVYL